MTRSMVKRLICLVLSLSLLMSTAGIAENTAATEYTPLRVNMKNDDVSAMQARLRELGYFEGAPTGGYYSVTVQAVADFQRMAGLEVNGKLASSEMLALLYSAQAPTVTGGVYVPTPKPTATPTGMLTFGMKDSDGVRQMQKRLEELGYFYNSITGNFFEGTQRAVEAFQQAAGLTVNGKAVGEETLNALYSESAPAYGASTAVTVTPLPTPTPAPVLTQVPGATPRPALKYGAVGDQVKALQARLRELGYFSGTPTGGYYSVTAKAVAAFLKAANMEGDGKVASSEMQELLFTSDAPVKGGSDTVPEIVQLQFGMSGSTAVRAMQDRLRVLGYFKDVSTGGYYRLTAQAVEDFQKAAGLTVNGNVATVEMLNALYAENAPVYGTTLAPTAAATPVATETPAVTETPAPTDAPAETEAPAETTAPDASAYATLSYGMTGSDAVRALQTKLHELGYLSASPTGGYWSQTVKAVRNFLKDCGMSGDGKTATPEMQARLFSGQLPSDDGTVVEYVTLKYGMKGNVLVRDLQSRLKALGYFDESCTGNYYSITAAAVEAFQKAAGLTVDANTASVELQQLLFSANAPHFGTTIAPTATPVPEATTAPESTKQPEISTNYQPLTYGMNNSEEVRAMQLKLLARGFFSGNATGGYWSQTRKAVEAFQIYAKLPVNGKVASAEMLTLLYYSGNLDELIANGGLNPDLGGSDATGGSEEETFDETKYQDARTDVLLSKGSSGAQVNFVIMRLTELGYLSSTPTSYDSDVVSAVKWFQNTNSLDSDGVAGPLTLKKLYSAEAISAEAGMEGNTSNNPSEVEGEEIKVTIGSVENVDWFSTEGETYYDRRNGVFKDGATAIVTDVASGISFRIRRSGGYNHADVEPVSEFDTWQMFKAYNYEWSWTRHAIWVTLENGVTLAGSMNCMPHGSSDDATTSFNGHFCIHFLNSRTHGSDKVDPDHQAAVDQAAK